MRSMIAGCAVLAMMFAVCLRAEDASKAEVEALKKEVEQLKAQQKSALKKGNVLSVIAVKTSAEEAEAFVKAFTDSPKASHKMKGFLGLAVAENMKEPGTFLVISSWESEDALNAYVKSPEFVQDHEKSLSVKSAKPEKPGRYVVKED
jgi:heme-degrading monooxygenase HmoA